jgi:hypothetical protein
VADGDTFTMEAAACTAPTSDLASGVYDAIIETREPTAVYKLAIIPAYPPCAKHLPIASAPQGACAASGT